MLTVAVLEMAKAIPRKIEYVPSVVTRELILK